MFPLRNLPNEIIWEILNYVDDLLKLRVILEDNVIRKSFIGYLLVVSDRESLVRILGDGIAHVSLENYQLPGVGEKILERIRPHSLVHLDISQNAMELVRALNHNRELRDLPNKRITLVDEKFGSTRFQVWGGCNPSDCLSSLQYVPGIHTITFSLVRKITFCEVMDMNVSKIRFTNLEELTLSGCTMYRGKSGKAVLVAPKLTRLIVRYDFASINQALDYRNTPLLYLELHNIANFRVWKNVNCPSLEELVASDSVQLARFKHLNFPSLRVFRFHGNKTLYGQPPSMFRDQRTLVMFKFNAPVLYEFFVNGVVICRLTELNIPYESVRMILLGRNASRKVKCLCLDKGFVKKCRDGDVTHGMKVFTARKEGVIYDANQTKMMFDIRSTP